MVAITGASSELGEATPPGIWRPRRRWCSRWRGEHSLPLATLGLHLGPMLLVWPRGGLAAAVYCGVVRRLGIELQNDPGTGVKLTVEFEARLNQLRLLADAAQAVVSRTRLRRIETHPIVGDLNAHARQIVIVPVRRCGGR